MAKMLGEVCVNSLHGQDVFSGDAEVVEVDLEFPIGKVFDFMVFALVFVVVCWDEGVVGRRWDFSRGVCLRSARVWFPLHRHVVVSGRTAGERQNCWCRIPFGTKRSQQHGSARAKPRERSENHKNGTKINATA